MHHTEVLGATVQVTRCWLADTWIVTSFLHRGDDVPTVQAVRTYSADVYDANDLEPVVHAIYTDLLASVSAQALLNDC